MDSRFRKSRFAIFTVSPWHWKQFFSRIGRTLRATKPISGGAAGTIIVVGKLVVQATTSITGKILTAEDNRRLAEETAKQIGSSKPAAVTKGGLDDDIDARPHCLQGFGNDDVNRALGKVDGVQPLRTERLHVPALVFKATLLQQDERRVHPGGSGSETARYREIEGSAVATGQELGEV
jgi:hypothetical protein